MGIKAAPCFSFPLEISLTNYPEFFCVLRQRINSTFSRENRHLTNILWVAYFFARRRDAQV